MRNRWDPVCLPGAVEMTYSKLSARARSLPVESSSKDFPPTTGPADRVLPTKSEIRERRKAIPAQRSEMCSANQDVSGLFAAETVPRLRRNRRWGNHRRNRHRHLLKTWRPTKQVLFLLIPQCFVSEWQRMPHE